MSPVALIAVAGAATAVAALALVAALLARGRAGRRATDEQLRRSRAEVEALGHQVATLAGEVERAQEAARAAGRAAQADREYVITSLAQPGGGDGPGERVVVGIGRRSLGEALEEQLVAALARRRRATARPVTGLVVRTAAVAHGVRRALSPDVLDRAAAEAHVARRRSRRDRRRQEREARRLLRAVRTQRVQESGEPGRGQDAA